MTYGKKKLAKMASNTELMVNGEILTNALRLLKSKESKMLYLTLELLIEAQLLVQILLLEVQFYSVDQYLTLRKPNHSH